MRRKVLFLILIVLALTGCADKTVNTDTIYCFHGEINDGLHEYPQLYLDSEKQSFRFVYDFNDNGIRRHGKYEIAGNKLILTGINKDERYVFRIVNENTLSFVQKESNEVKDETGYYYPVSDGDLLYDFHYKPYTLSEFDLEKIFYYDFTSANDDYLEKGFEYAKYNWSIRANWQDDKMVIREICNQPGYLTLYENEVPVAFYFHFDGLSSPHIHGELSAYETEDLYDVVKSGKKTAMVFLKLGEIQSAYYVMDEDGRIYIIIQSANAGGPADGQIVPSEQLAEFLPYMASPELYKWDGVLR